jgi:hypothetical protein
MALSVRCDRRSALSRPTCRSSGQGNRSLRWSRVGNRLLKPQALNAGVDLLLVAFDSAQFYRIFACASDAAAHNRLDPEMLRASQARLDRAFPRRASPRAPSISQGADARPIGE